MRRIFLFLVFFSCAVNDAICQDVIFTQFYANPIYLNPAFAGSMNCPRICMNYRHQWPNIDGTYVTYSASYDQHVNALGGGIGIIAMTDDQARGTLKTSSASFAYSYYLPVTRKFYMRGALQASYFQKVLDKSKLNFGDMIDPRRGFVWNTAETVPSSSKSNVDFSAGLIGYSSKYFFGLAVNHINQPDEGLLGPSKLPVKVTLHAGAQIQLEKREEHYLSPNILFQQQEKFVQMNIGLYYINGPFVAGLWYRNSDAMIALIGIQNKKMRFGYSYDVTISKLAGNTAGSHEISAQLNLSCRHVPKRHSKIECPHF